MQFKFINPNNFFYILLFFSFLNFGLPMLTNGFEIFTRYHLLNPENWYFYKLEFHYILETYFFFFFFILISFFIFKISNHFFNKNFIKSSKYKVINYLNLGEKKIALIIFFLIFSIFFLNIGIIKLDGFILQILFNLKFFLYISTLYLIFNFKNNFNYFIFFTLFFFFISFVSIIMFNGSIVDLFFIFLMYVFLTAIFRKKTKIILISLIIIFFNVLISQSFKHEIRTSKFFSTTKVSNYTEIIDGNIERQLSYNNITRKAELKFVPSGVIFNPLVTYNPTKKMLAYLINQINTIYNRFNKVNEFAWVIKLHREEYFLNDTKIHTDENLKNLTFSKKEYKKGETYKNLFTKIIPRFILPDKGRENLGNSFGREYLILPITDYTTSINLHVLIESYINFGFKGVIFCGIFFGLFIFISYSICIRRKNLFSSLLLSVPILVFSTSLESNFSSSFGGVIFQYLLIYFFIFFINQLALVSKNFQVVSHKLLS